MSGKPVRRGQSNGLKPNLSGPSIPLNVNVGRFTQIVAIEKDTIWASVFDRRHRLFYNCLIGSRWCHFGSERAREALQPRRQVPSDTPAGAQPSPTGSCAYLQVIVFPSSDTLPSTGNSPVGVAQCLPFCSDSSAVPIGTTP